MLVASNLKERHFLLAVMPFTALTRYVPVHNAHLHLFHLNDIRLSKKICREIVTWGLSVKELSVRASKMYIIFVKQRCKSKFHFTIYNYFN